MWGLTREILQKPTIIHNHPQSESTWKQEDALEIRTESERVYMAGGEAWRKLKISDLKTKC
jgi:hypothetical protein